MNSHPHVLLVDDDTSLLQLLAMRLEANGYTVTCKESGNEALSFLESTLPQLVITDLKMEPMDGMALYQQISQRWPTLPVIFLTAHGSIPEAVKATQQGAFAFLTKPIDKHELQKCIEQALALNAPQAHKVAEDWRNQIITRSLKMQDTLEQAKMVAVTDVNILITGESGTGKEVLANAIHRASPRANNPFIAVNCSAIPQELLESELFGHKKGAFTGAIRNHDGLFKAADNGTLFLDEIGDMPTHLQVKLLRVIQEQRIRPLGSSTDIQVNVRIISATHRNLLEEVESGTFREDLYYRLNVVNLHLIPLDQRKEDIPLLVNHFLNSIAERTGQPCKKISTEGVEALVSSSWPGNIRQLSNAVEQSVALTTGSVIPPHVVQRSLASRPHSNLSLSDAKKAFEKEYVIQLLKMADGNITLAAKLAQRNRSDFHKILKRHHIDTTHYKE